MELVGFALILFVVGSIVAMTLVSALFIWIGAKFAGIKGATLWKSFKVALISSFLVWAATGLGSFLFGIGAVLGWIIGTLITLWIIKSFFKTTWGKALLTWILQAIAQFLALGLIAVIAAALGMGAAGLLLF